MSAFSTTDESVFNALCNVCVLTTVQATSPQINAAVDTLLKGTLGRMINL